ncbi:uncharacterized protein [Ptychodera flava]|uniref:uncharacterized protein isoform X2 n=1 Tax=Ptychodera flava TaxID=63121 RepID=UPI00396A5395
MDDTGGFSESVEVPLKNSVTIVVEDCNGCCRLTESGFPLGCLREQECHEFWNFATEKKLISSICSIFENTCRQLVKEVKEGTASTKEKNELINFLCRTGAVRLKFTDLATIINQRRKGVARRSVTTPESSANSTISREPTPQTYETQPHPQQACQWAVVQESNYQPTQRSDPEYRGVEVQQSLAAPSFAEMSRLPPAAIEAGPSQLTLIRKYLISAKQDEQDKPSKEDDVFNEEDEEEDVSDDEIMENCNCDDEDETVGQKRKKLKALVTTKENPSRFADVTVSSAKLCRAEKKALSGGDYLGALLNEVIDLVFTRKELANAGGLGLRRKSPLGEQERPPLDQHRVNAIRVYLAKKAKKRGVKRIDSTTFNKKFTAKMGNARRDIKRLSKHTSQSAIGD